MTSPWLKEPPPIEQINEGSPDKIVDVYTEDGVKLNVSVWNVRGSRPASISKPLMAVLVHQWSKLGGCQAIMRGIARQLAQRGLSVVAFDMRGVGRSSGRSTLCGKQEVKDVEAVCKWAHQMYDQNLILIGSSAGAPIAGSALGSSEHIKGFVGIGYLFGWWTRWLFGSHIESVLSSRKPKLFIMGDHDGFTSVAQLEAAAQMAAPPKEVYIYPGVGHFELEGQKYDKEIAKTVMAWAEENAKFLCS